ncbi:bolA-like protein 3 isoform X3 [Cavia porcellus]|uniref:bolA-like protein 3 isoform X3 n=1 Tax=Cavia porcellus TaxID=10141 RepID=UPI000661AC89|nr:bolA-like protein 3 isoform X3 [Cavia porcellus]
MKEVRLRARSRAGLVAAGRRTARRNRAPEAEELNQGGERPPALQLPLLYFVHRMFASQTEGELKVTQVLREKFPQATAIKVTDISGTKRRNQRDARTADIYLCPQTLTLP